MFLHFTAKFQPTKILKNRLPSKTYIGRVTHYEMISFLMYTQGVGALLDIWNLLVC